MNKNQPVLRYLKANSNINTFSQLAHIRPIHALLTPVLAPEYQIQPANPAEIILDTLYLWKVRNLNNENEFPDPFNKSSNQ
jgi:hypothetical protein